MYTKEYISKLKSYGLVNLVSKYTEPRKVSSTLYIARCPHPDHNDSTASFRIFIDDKGEESWACMGCHCGKKDGKNNYGSDSIAFVQWISDSSNSTHKMSFRESLEYVAKFYGIAIQENPFSSVYANNNNASFKHNKNHTFESYAYLVSRGLDISDINKWRIGYDGKRIVIPIMDSYNNVLGFSNRLINQNMYPHEPKYLNTEESKLFQKRSIFYGINHFNNTKDSIYITEGQFDVILAHKYGLDTCVSTLGCALTDEHIEAIKKMNKAPVLCYDNDRAGMIGMKRAYEKLTAAGVSNVKIFAPQQNVDLADIAHTYKNNFVQYVEDNTQLYIKYEVDKVLSVLDNKISNEIQKAMNDISCSFKTLNNKDELDFIENYVKKRLHLWR